MRQRKHWHDIPGGFLAMVANGTNLAGSFTASGGEPFTVLRMFGEYVITATGAPTALDKAIITVGIGVVSADAAALGATALPDPEDESDYPWLYWSSHPLFFVDASVDPIGASGVVRKQFDVGSMRKISPRESLVFVVQYADVVGTPPVTITLGGTRFLIGT